jgi:predicted site-specific integrase-resolvase
MEHKCSRKYNTDFRKKLVSKFDKLKNKNEYIDIYNIIIEDIGTNFSTNRNGIFINMNLLSDNCIDKLIEFMDDKLNLTLTQTENEKVNYKSYKIDDVEIISEMGHKLSNQEKNIIKRIRNKVLT